MRRNLSASTTVPTNQMPASTQLARPENGRGVEPGGIPRRTPAGTATSSAIPVISA